jgi:hypothetical protein
VKGRASSSTVPAKRSDRVCCPGDAEDDTVQGVAEDKLANGDRQHNQRGEQGGEAAYQHNDGAQHPSVGVTDTWLDEPTKLGGETERGHHRQRQERGGAANNDQRSDQLRRR